jgi:hypothetical protein
LDVLGLDFTNSRAYLCEVTTHICGLLYGSSKEETIDRISNKYQRQQRYAREHLTHFKDVRFMLWSPVVQKGVRQELEKLTGLELVINGDYKRRVEEMRRIAAKETYDAKNPFFRILQILEHMRD